MATAPVDIPVQVKGLSDLQKLERRMEALEKEVTRLNGKLPKAANNVRGFGRASKGAAGGVKALGTAIKSTLAPLVAATTAMAGFAAGFRTIAGQDFAIAKVESLGVNSAALTEELKKVSAELEGNASVAELTAAAYDVASAGFTDAADAAKVLKAASLGATGGFTDINTVADAATSVLNAYGKSADEAGKLIDGFIQTQNDGKIVVAQYAANIAKVAPVASGLGIKLDEINAVIAQVTAGGTNAEVAFTGLKTALAQLASGNANKALAEIGVNISTADIKSKGLIGVLQEIKDSGVDVGLAFKAFGNEAAPVLQAVFNDLEKTNQLLENQENSAGAAQAAQEKAADTINGAWNRVRVAFENLFSDQAALAQAIIPILDSVAGKINELAQAIEGWKSIIADLEQQFKDLATAAGVAEEALDGLPGWIKAIGEEAYAQLNPLGALIDKLMEVGKARAFANGQKSKDIYNVAGIQYDKNMVPINGAVDPSTWKNKPKTKVTPFNPSLSGGGGGGGGGGADKATRELERQREELERQFQAGEDIKRNQENSLALLRSANDLDKERLQIAIDLDDAIRQIQQTAAPSQQEGLIFTATEEARLKDMIAVMESGGASLGKSLAEGLPEVNEELTQTEQLLSNAYGIVANNLTSGIQGLIDGTKEWGDVLGDIASQLGSMFLQAGFNGLGSALKIPGYAEGGRPAVSRPAIVGERGPELFVPDSAGTVISNDDIFAATRSALSGGGVGAADNSEGNADAFAAAAAAMNTTRESRESTKMMKYAESEKVALANPAPINIKYDSRVINSETFVTEAQFQQGLKQSANQARAMTISDLRNKPASRKRAGVG